MQDAYSISFPFIIIRLKILIITFIEESASFSIATAAVIPLGIIEWARRHFAVADPGTARH
jgi:hypothetical protein